MQINTHSSVEAAIEVTEIESINVTDVTDTGIREKTEGTGIQAPLVTWVGVVLELIKILLSPEACLALMQLRSLCLLDFPT